MPAWDPNSGSMDENNFWFALKVRERYERHIADALAAKDIESFLPVYSVRRQWSDRVKSLEVPLFAGYVFCRINPARRSPILIIPGVQYFVGIGREPQPVEDSEIESIRTLVRSGMASSPRPYLTEGQRVRVQDGPLRGVEGVLVKAGDAHQLVLSIDLLQRSVAVTLDRDSVLPVASRPYGGVPAALPMRVAL